MQEDVGSACLWLEEEGLSVLGMLEDKRVQRDFKIIILFAFYSWPWWSSKLEAGRGDLETSGLFTWHIG